MTSILSFLPTLFGTVLNFINDTVGNYGLAIIIFTILIRLIIFPLTIKQLQSAAKMQDLQPKLKDIQERYKTDKEKLSQEQMKLYKDEGVNPFGGCLPLLVQMPILFSLLYAFAQPLTYQLGRASLAMSTAVTLLPGSYKELTYVIQNQDIFHFNMNFLGINLGKIPTLDVSSLENILALVLVLLATACTYLSIKISMNRPNQPLPTTGKDGKNQMAQMNKTMMLMLPAMTLFFSFSFPAGLTLYWMTGYIIQIFQQLAINKWFHGKKKEVAK